MTKKRKLCKEVTETVEEDDAKAQAVDPLILQAIG